MVSKAVRYFEDYVVGTGAEVGKLTLTEAEIIEFANRYDPQDFHTDPQKAANGPFGGLVASGWQTAAAVMRVLVDHYLDSASSLGSPGLDGLRWLAPVRPADVLTVFAKISSSRRSRSATDRGLLKMKVELFNQHAVCVMTIDAVSMIACRPASETGERQ